PERPPPSAGPSMLSRSWIFLLTSLLSAGRVLRSATARRPDVKPAGGGVARRHGDARRQLVSADLHRAGAARVEAAAARWSEQTRGRSPSCDCRRLHPVRVG